MERQNSFNWAGALPALLGRFPSLEDEPQLGALLQSQNPPSILRILDALQSLLIRPSLTLAIGSCFRPVLLSLVSALVDARLSSATCSSASHAAISVALVSLLDLAPHLERVVVRYMEAAEPTFHQLLAGPQSLLNVSTPIEPITQIHMARAALRMLQLCPGLGDEWSLAPIHSLLLQSDADVRWAGVECMAIMTKMSDAGKESLRAQVLSGEEALACGLRWRQDRLRYTVERAGLWMQPPPHFCSMSGSEALPGPDSSSAGPSSGMSEQMLPASGFVSLCGIELPCRGTPGLASAAQSRGPFVMTETVSRNLEAAALVLCQRRPLLLEGPPGSGKSALVEKLAAVTGNSDFIHMHVDDQMDAKSLLGAYVCTTVPGEFVWQPGPLTQAVAEGKWLVIEDINLAPMDVLAALIPLLERRQLQLPQRAQSLSAAEGFQLLATITSSPGGGSGGAYGSSQGVRDLLGSLLASVTVQPPAAQEQLTILSQTHPLLAPLLPAALATLRLIRLAAGQATPDKDAIEGPSEWDSLARGALEAAGLHAGDAALHVGRHFSMRDVLKWCRRMQSVHAPLLQRSVRRHDRPEIYPDVSVLPVAMREAAFLESADCYTVMIAKPEARRKVLAAMLALWALPEDVMEQYLVLKKPMIQENGADVIVGRAVLPKILTQAEQNASKKARKFSFARTGQAMRAMEAVAVATAQQEPVLLVGETGTGKTTLVQQIAEQVGANLVVLNLSQQTDSADLLGGFQPVEPRHALLPLLDRFQGIVRRTWHRGNNDEFLGRAIKYAQRRKWSSLLKAFHTAIGKVEAADSQTAGDDEAQGSKRAGKRKKPFDSNLREEWLQFKEDLTAAERAAKVAEGGFAFAFKEGALVQALRNGDWILLDEINLAPSEALERLAGLLENERASITLMEKGTTDAVPRQANFRLFAAMNPATDAGKRELPAALRNRFTEIFVPEPSLREDLRGLVAAYLRDTVPNPPLDAVVDFYLAAKLEAERKLVDGAGSKPAYNLRTLCRALEYARTVLPVYGLQRALYDGCSMAFHTQLAPSSAPVMEGLLQTHILGPGTKMKALLRAPAQPQGGSHVLFDHFWVEAGDQPLPESGAEAEAGRVQFVATPSVQGHLRSLARASLTRRYPVLLQGPTSSGKTSLVTHLARATGHRCVRINNHEQTDLQEYLGSYVADEAGRLVFREGALVTAVRAGHWVILDELNLAPSEVLEALNRLLDDNRELYVPELGEVVRPHPHFMLFATQNPAGAYGGRKALSRAFRSRFLELHVGDIPDSELAHILQLRCALAPSYAAKLVAVMRELQRQRQATNVFAGKHGFITPRDLFKWAGRGAVGYQELGENGYLLLAERLRNPNERALVQKAIEDTMRVKIDSQELYQREGGAPQLRLQEALRLKAQDTDAHTLALQAALSGIVWTASMRRMYTLVDRCLENAEPVLLVGETGTGKTTVCQMAALMRGQRLHILNCNQHTEVSDFLGGFRPARDRAGALVRLEAAVETIRASPLVECYGINVPQAPASLGAPDLLDTAKAATKAVNAVEAATKDDGSAHEVQGLIEALRTAAAEATSAAVAARAPFQWVDGPLVTAMRQGDIILIDELNLAEDAVLERMNSVLEPGRTLTLAEKGGMGAEEVVAAAGFRLVATMNPGGDYGKRELSPALANRFTTIWVPPIEDEAELAQILNARLSDEDVRREVAGRLLGFWRFFRGTSGPAAGGALSVRDLLAWAGFVNAAAPRIGALAAYAHGAHLVLLDGIGLGIGLPAQTAQRLHAMCQEYLLQQLPEAARPAALAAAGHMVLDTSDAHPQHSAGPHDEDPNAMNIDNNASCTTVAQGVTAGVASPGSTWGIPPFFVERGPHGGAESGAAFDFRAPTTARNALRVLRALQLKRSVLLEGSPGVGKTALVAALARASGRRHVRINLSEQTDIMDLLGADLPVEGGLPGQFAWCDGPLLAALKAGDWVLLDELNLAGQSVLEGLNALLDHRAEVYIPELGASFQCPPTFRIFAAQNPVQEGGGRRGLPKSFLNRFTRVHVELLDVHDLHFIAGSLHPAVPVGVRQRMISFLQTLHVGANKARSFGGVGGPWEFNLRDLLRWCQLVETVTGARQAGGGDGMAKGAAAHFARLLFLQRMRTAADRAFVSRAFAEHWGTALPDARLPSILASPEAINIGWASLQRSQQGASMRDEVQLLQGQGAALESLAQCMQLSWMCILVGPSGSGKTSLAQVVAGLTGQELVQIALTSSTDTSDLLGGFEQLEPRRQLQEAADEVGCMVSRTVGLLLCGPRRQAAGAADASGLADRLQLSKQISDAWTACKTSTSSLADSPSLEAGSLQQALGGLQEVLTQLTGALAACPAPQLPADAAADAAFQISKASRSVADLTTTLLERIGDGVAGRFEWVDGALTRAIEEGRWVLLDNANMCMATVLDRLNPLLEPAGTLLLNEAGTANGRPRVLRPHPNFRLILALDPKHGELSRAMRNRGIEVFVADAPAEDVEEEVDATATLLNSHETCESQDPMALLALQGVPGSALPRSMVAAHLAVAQEAARCHRRRPSARELKQWASLARLLCEQGWPPAAALATGWRHTYVSSQSSPGARAFSAAAFERHCADTSADVTPPNALALSLYRPAAWPEAVSAAGIAADSQLAALEVDAAVVTHLLAQIGAAEVACSAAAPSGVSGAFGAAALPALLLMAHLRGDAPEDGGMLAAVQSLGGMEGLEAGVDRGLRLLRFAVLCFAERASTLDWRRRLQWLSALSELAAGLATESRRAREAIAQASKAVADALRHATFQELLQLWPSTQTLLEAILLPDAQMAAKSRPLLPGTLAMVPQEALWALPALILSARHSAVRAAAMHTSLLSAVLKAAGAVSAPSVLQLSYTRYINPQVRAWTAAPHPVLDSVYPALAALSAFEAALLNPQSDHQLLWTAQLAHQVALFQEWRDALWQLVHGGLTSTAAPAALALQEEPFAFAWLRLTKALRAIAAAAPGAAALAEAERLAGIVDQVNRGLGLNSGPPPKPLLWRHGGHPSNPPSLELWNASRQLRLLCDAARAPASGSFGDSSAAAQLISQTNFLGEEESDDMQIGPDGERRASRETVAAVAAALSSDWGLRRALLEGMGLFTMASALAAGRKSGPSASRLAGMDAAQAANSALAIVSALQERAEKAVEQALAKTGDERSIIRNGAPLLDKPLGGGALPEVFPLQLMVNNTIHLLTLELLPFQDHWTLQSQRQILHAATVMSLSQKRIDVSETKEAMRMLLLPGYTGAGRSIGDFAPLQLLLWLLDAEDDGANAQQQLPQLAHEMWFTWHAALWDCNGRSQSPTAVSHASLSGLVAAVLDASRKSSLATRTARSLQLKLAARHVSKWSTEKALPTGPAAAALEWASLGALLASVIAAHRPSLPDVAVHEALDAAVASLLDSTAVSGAADTPAARAEGLAQHFASLLATSSHSLLVQLLQPVLLPLLSLVLEGSQAAKAAGSAAAYGADMLSAEAKRGAAWVLLGAARLHLASPPPGADPAAKYSHKRVHLLAVLDDVLAELEVRRALQRLPLGPDESHSIAALEQRAAALRARAEELRAQTVPRPQPSQYPALQQELARFMHNLGSVQRMAALLQALQAGQHGAVEQAGVWQQNADAWSIRLLPAFPLYADLLQPVALAIYEMRAGFSMLTHAQTALQTVGTSLEMGAILAQLMAFPATNTRAGALLLYSPAAVSVTASTARHSASGQSAVSVEVAVYSARLNVLRAALHSAAQAVLVAAPNDSSPAIPITSGLPSGPMQQFEAVLTALLGAWEEVKAAEEARAQLEAQLYKTKAQSTTILTEEEEEEADYKLTFPDHSAAFADILDAEGDDGMLELAAPAASSAEEQATEAEAGSAAAHALLQGDLLEDIVQEHARVFRHVAGAQGSASELDSREVFKHAYDLGALLMSKHASAGGVLPSEVDADTASGHLMRICLEQQRLSEAPAATSSDAAGPEAAFDMEKPSLAEAGLMEEPVQALRARLAQLLADWPDHPILAQLLVLCDRLLGMAAEAPLKAALTGLELLLARSQVWQETAASHVSLTPQLERLAALALRWRRLQLSAWRSLIRTLGRRHAAGAHRSWFHLYRMLMAPSEADADAAEQDMAVAVEQFMQSATLGEFQRRLDLIWTFRCQAAAKGSLAQKLAALLENVHSYYGQFLPLVDKAIKDSLAPIEKRLEDFVKLAKWEDRGYHSLKQSTEKAQRQLHKLQRQANAALKQPSAAVLADAAKAMGMADLTAPESIFTDSTRQRRKKAEAASPTEEEFIAQAAQDVVHWRAFCTAVTAYLTTLATPVATEAEAVQADGATLYHQRIPQLAQRMQTVLASTLEDIGRQASHAGSLDSLAGEVAQRALELRGAADKGARSRKKKALTDLLQALAAAGLSKQRSAVPSAERSVHSWFTQASPGALLDQLLEAEARSQSAVPVESVAQARTLWSKADTYYFRNVARIQRLWEAAQAPSKDLSQREVAAAQRLSEHALFLQRRQRAFLGRLAAAAARLRSLAATLSDFSDGADAPVTVPPQDAYISWSQKQAQQLEDLDVLVGGSVQLLEAFAAVESAAQPNKQLKAAYGCLQSCHMELAACKQSLQSVLRQCSTLQVLTPAHVRIVLHNQEVLHRLEADLSAEEHIHAHSKTIPNWSNVQHALAKAAMEGAHLQAAACTSTVSTDPTAQDASLQPVDAWSSAMEAAVTSVLLWAQAAQASGPAEAHKPGGAEEGGEEEQAPSITDLMKELEGHAALQRLDATCSAAEALTAQIAALGTSDAPAGAGAMAAQSAALAPLLGMAAGALQAVGARYLALHKALAKLGYVAGSLFVGLMQEGFCTAEASEEEAVGGEGGSFKEAEGTGMGEGEGAKDVSDQITDEDQLLGAQQKDQPADAPKEEEAKQQPKEEEDAKGVEMEGDFEGDIHDVPSDAENSEEEEGDEEEGDRLDQEMGDVGEQGEVVDERMWGDEDKPEPGQKPGEEKYEKDAPVQVDDKKNLEYQAGQEEEAGGEQGKEPQEKDADGQKDKKAPDEAPAQDQEGGDEEQAEEDGEGPINEDTEEGYEQRQFAAPQAPEEELELPEDMALDGEQGDEEGQEGNEEETGAEHPHDAVQQPFPEGADKEDAPGDQPDEQGPDTATPEEGPPEEGAEEEDEAGAKALEEGGRNQALDDAAEAGEEEEEEAEPAAQHGWEGEQPQQEALPEAGPKGLASQAAAAQAAAQPDARGVGDTDEKEAEAAGGQDQGPMAEDLSAPATPPQAHSSRLGASEAGRQGRGRAAAAEGGEQPPSRQEPAMQQANPYRSLGDAMEQWRRRLSVNMDSAAAPDAQDAAADEAADDMTQDEDAAGGSYEFVPEGDRKQADDTQALAPATEEQAREAAAPEAGGAGGDNDEDMPDAGAASDEEEATVAQPEGPDDEHQALQGSRQQRADANRRAGIAEESTDEEMGEEAEQESDMAGGQGGLHSGEEGHDAALDSFVASLLQRTSLNGSPGEDIEGGDGEVSEEEAAALRAQMEELLRQPTAPGSPDDADAQYGRDMWARCEALTAGLAGELAEQLRLILEPTRATRLAGEYRSGKRLNMRRVIAYIASHFRKDKIWLRRTRPDQRTYQVVLAVDDSRSMAENGCGGFALEAVTLLARALARLEVGQLGVLRFGGTEHVRLLHALDGPFTDANGPDVLSALRFDQDNTLADRPMVELLTMLMHMLDLARASAAAHGAAQQLHQLVLVLADGRFHEKDSLRRMVMEASSRPGVLLAFIILDNPAASVLDMQAVQFVGGQPSFSKYLDSFPFPFYIVLRDLASLPSTLASLLRQWFELSAAGAMG